MAKRYRSRKAYCCWECDKAYFDKEFAQRCCEVKTCARCGAKTEKHYAYTACEPCREILLVHRAEVVATEAADDGVVWSDTHQGDWEDGYASEVDALLERCRDEGVEPPCYVHPCKATHFQFDPSDIYDRVHDNHHEDAVDQIVDSAGLFLFFKEWNAKQTLRSYYMDRSKIIVLDQARFDALLAQPKALSQ